MAEKLLTVPEAATKLGVKERTVRRWVLLRRVTYVKLGSCVRIPESELARLIDEGTVKRVTDSWHSEEVATASLGGS